MEKPHSSLGYIYSRLYTFYIYVEIQWYMAPRWLPLFFFQQQCASRANSETFPSSLTRLAFFGAASRSFCTAGCPWKIVDSNRALFAAALAIAIYLKNWNFPNVNSILQIVFIQTINNILSPWYAVNEAERVYIINYYWKQSSYIQGKKVKSIC